jgi:hypothetical protein
VIWRISNKYRGCFCFADYLKSSAVRPVVFNAAISEGDKLLLEEAVAVRRADSSAGKVVFYT